jgi:radical SAM/Cys-rich protein
VTDALTAAGLTAEVLEEIVRPESGPRPTTSLLARRSPLADPRYQIASLEALDLSGLPHDGDFDRSLAGCHAAPLTASEVEIFQINLGKLCNMTCRHCHVDAGPDRWREMMGREIVDACLSALDRTGAHTVDLTGGAPELNPHFRYLVDECRKRGKHVIDRCNLTVLLVPRQLDLPQWLADREVEVVCSLPHYRRRNTDAQRGDGTFEKSIEALDRLNRVGYGQGDPRRLLTLMVNPVGAHLTGDQCSMERTWKDNLERNYGVRFDRLIALNNMPIARYLEWLEGTGNLQSYMELLVNSFNPATTAGLMCRNTLSVSWTGEIFDCDFNQMLALGSRIGDGGPANVRDFDISTLVGRTIVTGRHCFGCTAGAGSSCGGAIHDSSD